MADNLFELLTESDRLLLNGSARRQTYRRGETLFREGDIQPNFYVLRQGSVRVERQYQGHGLAVARYGPGAIVGEISFLRLQPAQGSVIAEEDVEVDVLEGRQLHGLLTSDPGFASRFYHALAVCLSGRLLEILPGIRLPEAFGGGAARARLPRTGQLSERQLPPELIDGVETFRASLRALAAEPPGGSEALRHVTELCDGLVGLLTHFTADDALVAIGMDDLLSFRDVPDLARGVGGYVFRETFSFFMLSATITQGFERPGGCPEDNDLLQRIELNEAEGDGRLGPLIDRWFLDRPLCQSRRNSLWHMTKFLRDVVANTRSTEPVRLTSLAAGTAREVFDLLAAAVRPCYVTCIDADADALLANARRAAECGCAERITFLQADLAVVVAGAGAVSLGPQQAIYGLGVCDYLDDEQVAALLDWAYDLLVPGGWLLLTNRDAAGPDRAFTEHILDWPIFYRTAADFITLFARSRFADAPPELLCEEAGVNRFIRCPKNA